MIWLDEGHPATIGRRWQLALASGDGVTVVLEAMRLPARGRDGQRLMGQDAALCCRGKLRDERERCEETANR